MSCPRSVGGELQTVATESRRSKGVSVAGAWWPGGLPGSPAQQKPRLLRKVGNIWGRGTEGHSGACILDRPSSSLTPQCCWENVSTSPEGL